MAKSSSELLREYANLIKEAEEEDFDANEFSSNEEQNPSDELENEPEDNNFPSSEIGDAVQELANYIDQNKEKQEEGIDLSNIIAQFLKEKHLDLVPTNGLENSEGDV